MGISNNVVKRFIEGDNEATAIIFEKYKNLLYFIIATYVSNSNDCDDLLSESFLKAIKHRKDITDLNNIKSFLTSIAKNEALQYLRKNKNNTSTYIDEMYGQEDNNNPLLDSLLPVLNSKETIIIYYKVIFSYSWKEIALETGIPVSTGKLIYKNALKKLRKALL